VANIQNEKGRRNKVKRLSLLVGLICLVTAAYSLAENLKAYENDKYGFYVSYPQTWQLTADETNGNFALYTPESLTNQPNNLDLEAGLKIEIIAQTKAELADWLARNQLNQKGQASNQYEFRDQDYYYLITVIRGPRWNFLLIGYFPEKQKEAVYVPLYQKVIATFTII
jgi:hypothetical protein